MLEQATGARPAVSQIVAEMALLRLLGHPVLERDGVRVQLGVRSKAVVLLAFLAANASRPLSRDWLAQTLWPDDDPADARANLRRHLHILSKTLEAPAFTLTRHTVQWNAACDLAVDVMRFEELSAAQPALALDEYGGELCTGIDDELLDGLRLRYRSQYETLLQRAIAAARGASDDAALLLWLQRLAVYDPLDEEAVCELMDLRRRNGDRSGALRDYKALASRLRAQLGVEPQPNTTALFREIAAEEPAHSHPNNLVPETTTFVGRESELSQLTTAMHEAPVVTITGPGGVGKSRLAKRFCYDALPSFEDGIWHVELEYARDETGVWERIASAAAPANGAGKDATIAALQGRRALIVLETCEHVLDAARAAADALAREAGVKVLATSRRRLNCEGERAVELQALEAPPAQMPSTDSPLRYPAYRLFLERAAMVSPAFRVEPRQLRALGDLLREVDGLPLAIELVASRANVLTIEGMRKRLTQTIRAGRTARSEGRGATLEDTVAWSYDLLTPAQREVFARLGVFNGTFTVDDVEAVCAEVPLGVESIFELVDASLVTVSGTSDDIRYRLLETTRLYARERLSQSGALHAATIAHAEHYARQADVLAAATEKAFSESIESTRLKMPDYLAALENAATRGWYALGLRIIDGLYRLAMRGHFCRELLHWALVLGEVSTADAPSAAHLDSRIGGLAEICNDWALASRHYQRAVAHYRQDADYRPLCHALTGLAVIEFTRGRHARSREYLEEVLERAKREEDRRLVVVTLSRLGILQGDDLERSISILQPAAEGLRELGELRQLAMTLRNLGSVSYYAGRYAESLAAAEEAVGVADRTSDLVLHLVCMSIKASDQRELGQTAAAVDSHLDALALCAQVPEGADVADCLEDVAATLSVLGAPADAARLVGFAAELRRRMGYPHERLAREHNDRLKERLRTSLGARYLTQLAAGANDNVETIIAFAADAMMRLQTARDRAARS